jgi:hypothetical protein
MFPRFEFQKAVKQTNTAYHARDSVPGSSSPPCSWASAQVKTASGGIEAGLTSHPAALYHLGVRPVHRSTPAYANAHRSPECLSLFNWAKFRTTKGAVKLQVELNRSGYLPAFAVMTTGKAGEQTVAAHIPLEKGRWWPSSVDSLASPGSHLSGGEVFTSSPV